MGLNWVRVDSAFARNHKIIELAHRKQWQAITAYICGLGYSGEHGLAGFIPEAALPWIHATPRTAHHLVDVELWHAVAGGWQINDWDQYQPSSEEQQRRREKAKRAAAARWSRKESQGDNVVSLGRSATDG